MSRSIRVIATAAIVGAIAAVGLTAYNSPEVPFVGTHIDKDEIGAVFNQDGTIASILTNKSRVAGPGQDVEVYSQYDTGVGIAYISAAAVIDGTVYDHQREVRITIDSTDALNYVQKTNLSYDRFLDHRERTEFASTIAEQLARTFSMDDQNGMFDHIRVDVQEPPKYWPNAEVEAAFLADKAVAQIDSDTDLSYRDKYNFLCMSFEAPVDSTAIKEKFAKMHGLDSYESFDLFVGTIGYNNEVGYQTELPCRYAPSVDQ